MSSINQQLERLYQKRLLVIGGLGFLGRWVIQTALPFKPFLTLIDRKRANDLLETERLTVIQGDISETSVNLEKNIEKSDYIVHLAGTLGTEETFSSLYQTMFNNILPTTRLIELCLTYKRRMVYTTVGNNWPNPYTISKKCAADLGIMANLECGGDFRILKIMNAYGPWQQLNKSQKIIPSFFHSCHTNQPIEIFGDGNQCIDLIHAKDVAIGILLSCVTADLPIHEYIELGTSIPIRVLEVAQMVHSITQSSSPHPKTVTPKKRKGEPLHSVTLATQETLKNHTGFIPQIHLQQGLIETYDWYKKNPSYLNLPAL